MQKTPLLILLILAACASPAGNGTSSNTDASLQSYLTQTPAATSTPNVRIVVETPVPTKTMQVYVIESGDTVSEIAEKFKIPQADLIAANPDVNPNALVIGATLFIPDPSSSPAAASTLTPMPVPVTQAACHPTADSGLWCFALIQNNTAGLLENISAQITLFDEDDNVIASQTAFTPLDIIPANSSLPVYIFFPNVSVNAKPQFQLLSAMQGNTSAYLPARLSNTVAQINWEGKSARLSGQVYLPPESKAATQVWVAAIAYDKNGTVVGVRRWEGEGLQSGGSLNFDFSVSSVGGVIEAVDFAVQAR